ncbi:MAG: chemotaxis protein CheA [Leptospiraceae bacterium]|nr:chemotaxis protein CheA [Leptospiraceae bacterium]
MNDFDLEEIKETYITECYEILGRLETTLLYIESNPITKDHIDEMFRAFHTIKGTSGVFGYEHIVEFTHVVESLMEEVRSKKVELIPELISVLLECKDHITILIDLVAKNEETNADIQNNQKVIIQKLNPYVNVEPKRKGAEQPGSNLEELSSDLPWHISIRFKENTFKNGLEPIALLNFLNHIGKIINLIPILDHIPSLEHFDPENCYLGFEIEYVCNGGKELIEQAFEFVVDDCLLHILPPKSKFEDYLELMESLPEKNFRVLRILLFMGALSIQELREYNKNKKRKKKPPEKQAIGQVSDSKSTEDETIASVKPQRLTKESKIIRIDSTKLDHLINLVGELVIANANINQIASDKKDNEMIEAAYQVNHLVSEIRENALKLRMVQIGETFSRFQRVVRDVGKELDKDIELSISGGETELDKTVVEKINDPLMHLIRNAIDHGIESKEDRIAKNKSPKGKLSLHAYHETGFIVIEVKDDGKGFSKEKIYKKAIEKKIVSPDQVLSEQQIMQLVFQPGFSTAESITNISGRGVGLDVVSKNIESLRGTVSIYSEENQGSMIKIRLPLTLAIIDGFMVSIGSSYYVVPLDIVVECIEYKPSNVQKDRNFLNLRGEVLPFIRLYKMFQIKSSNTGRKNILVVQFGDKKAGILVDSLHGEVQIVIKPLGKIFSHLKGVSGSTILGNGAVALILDIPSLISITMSQETKEKIGQG